MYAKENGLNDVVLLNDQKKVTETLNGTIFLLKTKPTQTPNLLSGCQNLVLREVFFVEWLIKYIKNYNVIEREINPFELQKSEEIFIISLENGLQCVSNYRKSSYLNDKSYHLFEKFLSYLVELKFGFSGALDQSLYFPPKEIIHFFHIF